MRDGAEREGFAQRMQAARPAHRVGLWPITVAHGQGGARQTAGGRQHV